MQVTEHILVTATHIDFRAFPCVMLGKCWEQTEQNGCLESLLADQRIMSSLVARMFDNGIQLNP